jgi:hypothetical protein
MNLAAIDRFFGFAPGFKKPGGPEPFIQSDTCHRLCPQEVRVASVNVAMIVAQSPWVNRIQGKIILWLPGKGREINQNSKTEYFYNYSVLPDKREERWIIRGF